MIKAYDAETKRLSTVQASMSPEQIQDIVMGTVHSMITSGDLIAEMPQDRGGMGEEQMMPPPEQPMMPQEGMMPPPEQMQPPPMEQPT